MPKDIVHLFNRPYAIRPYAIIVATKRSHRVVFGIFLRTRGKLYDNRFQESEEKLQLRDEIFAPFASFHNWEELNFVGIDYKPGPDVSAVSVRSAMNALKCAEKLKNR